MGMGQVKRWVLPLLMAIVMVCSGAGNILRGAYSAPVTLPAWVGSVTLEFLPHLIRAWVFALAGIALLVLCLNNLVPFNDRQFAHGRSVDSPGGPSGS